MNMAGEPEAHVPIITTRKAEYTEPTGALIHIREGIARIFTRFNYDWHQTRDLVPTAFCEGCNCFLDL